MIQKRRTQIISNGKKPWGRLVKPHPHVTHGILRARKGVTLHLESQRKEGAKALKAGVAELNGRQELHGQCSQEGFLEEETGTNL